MLSEANNALKSASDNLYDLQTMQLRAEETCRRGQAIYESELREKLDTPENLGKFLAIDVDSGDFELGGRVEAGQKLRERHPEVVYYLVKVGYPAVSKRGGSIQPLPRHSPLPRSLATLYLPADVYDQLVDVAHVCGVTPAEWIAAQLSAVHDASR